MKTKSQTILLLYFFLTTFSAMAQTLSADSSGNVLFVGTLTGADKDNFEACRCLQEDVPLFEILSATENESDAKDGAFVKGSWTYHYLVDDDDKPAGWIAFDFEYIFKDGIVSYRYYNYVHSKEEEDSIFASVGTLPAVWNEKVRKVFTNEQYTQIQSAMTANVRVALNSIKRLCLK
ncbi:hypothetical protein AAEO56_15640 [Flavobacterium sp. DGU11]|uniref:DUF4468 domain-containing protein n=1 Tax=Flavobacterium arundinis TaxID=3139143 RepID=A0ABU9HZV7_9FLAO